MWDNLGDLVNDGSFLGLKNEYAKAQPFHHVVIDDFLKKDVIASLADEFPLFDDEVWHTYNNPLEVKKTCNDWNKFGKATYNFFHIFNKQETSQKLAEALGLTYELFPDPGLNGGGMHIHKAGGKLNTHLDYSVHPKLALQRRINIIIYLNKDWDTSWNGALGFWGNESQRQPGDLIKKIDPIYNRAVIFDTSMNSWHGLPEPVRCPANNARKSLAIYYLSSITHTATDRHRALFSPSDEQKGSKEIEELIRMRSGLETSKDTYT